MLPLTDNKRNCKKGVKELCPVRFFTGELSNKPCNRIMFILHAKNDFHSLIYRHIEFRCN